MNHISLIISRKGKVTTIKEGAYKLNSHTPLKRRRERKRRRSAACGTWSRGCRPSPPRDDVSHVLARADSYVRYDRSSSTRRRRRTLCYRGLVRSRTGLLPTRHHFFASFLVSAGRRGLLGGDVTGVPRVLRGRGRGRGARREEEHRRKDREGEGWRRSQVPAGPD